MSQTLKLTKDPIWFLLRKVTIPASVGSLFQTFYNLVDTWFAGRISAEAIAAIAKSFPIYFIIVAIGVGLTAGTNTLIGNNIGANNKKKASLFVAQSIIFAIFLSILVTFLGLNVSDFLLSVMGSDQAGIILSRKYLDIIFYGTIIVLIQISLNGTLNAQGDTKSYRNVLIFSFFLNIFLNPLFIFGYGFIPAFGIAGLAIATVVAQFIGLLYLAYKVYCCELKQYLKFQCFIPKFNLLGELVYQTIPVMFSMLLIGVGIFNILYFIGQFGDLATAGYGAALRIEQVFLLPVIGLNTAVLYRKALLFGSSFMICAGLIIFFGAEFLITLFTDNSTAIKHGIIYLKVAALIGPIYPVFFITTAVFQAVKKPVYSLYMSILRLTALPFLSLWYVINIRGGDYEDIFYTILITNWLMGIAVLIFIGYFLNNVFKQNKNLFTN